MPFKYTILLCLCLLASAAPVAAQDLSGQWIGDYYNEGANMIPTQQLVVQLNIKPNGSVSGTTFLKYKKGFEYYMIVGKYDPAKKLLFIKEFYPIKIDGLSFGTRMGNYTMRLAKRGGNWIFDGIWRDNKPNEFMAIDDSRVYFRRPAPKDEGLLKSAQQTTGTIKPTAPTQPAAPPRTTAPAAQKPIPPKPIIKQPAATATPALQRKSEVQSIIYLAPQERDSIKIELLDNAEYDGDRVSLYLNDKLLLKNYTITENAYVLYLSLSANSNRHKLKMVAESIGDTPPCTAYLRITTRKKQLGISLSSELQKNGMVEFCITQ